MIRSNIGNVVTNASQTVSVAGSASTRFLGRHDKTLNNKKSLNGLSEEEQGKYEKMRADKKREQIAQFEKKTDSAFRRLSEEEQVAYREAQANKMREASDVKEGKKDKVKSVDELMSNIKSMDTPQGEELAKHINTNSEYLIKRNQARDTKTGRFVSTKSKKEGDE